MMYPNGRTGENLRVARRDLLPYYDGAPCTRCGSPRRFTADHACVACHAEFENRPAPTPEEEAAALARVQEMSEKAERELPPPPDTPKTGEF